MLIYDFHIIVVPRRIWKKSEKKKIKFNVKQVNII